MIQKKKRQSLRFPEYDYAQKGLYYITICCANRLSLFGEIKDNNMFINDLGKIVHECWFNIPIHYPNVTLHEFIIMPNHLHGIIEINNNTPNVGANNHSPTDKQIHNNYNGRPNDYSPLQTNGTSKTLGAIVRGFKIGVTKWAKQNTDIENIWQPNYYERIIRNDSEYENFCHYIRNNPKSYKEK